MRVRSTSFLRQHLRNPWRPLSWWAAPYAMVKMTRVPSDGLDYHWSGILVDARGVLAETCVHHHGKREEARMCAQLTRDRWRRGEAPVQSGEPG